MNETGTKELMNKDKLSQPLEEEQQQHILPINEKKILQTAKYNQMCFQE